MHRSDRGILQSKRKGKRERERENKGIKERKERVSEDPCAAGNMAFICQNYKHRSRPQNSTVTKILITNHLAVLLVQNTLVHPP